MTGDEVKRAASMISALKIFVEMPEACRQSPMAAPFILQVEPLISANAFGVKSKIALVLDIETLTMIADAAQKVIRSELEKMGVSP